MREWLPTLNARKKWRNRRENLRVGQVVIVMTPDTPRGKWPLGRIKKLCPGRDGLVRVVEVNMGGKTLMRPFVKLCPLD